MTGPSIPHRIFPDAWPSGWSWEVTLVVNSNGYVTGVATMARHWSPDNNPRMRKSDIHTEMVGPFDEVLDVVREGIIASACDLGEQGRLF